MMHIGQPTPATPISQHTFNRAADRTIQLASKVSQSRAGEYHDSWSTETLITPWLDNLLRTYPSCPNPTLNREYKRLIIMASMLDIKLSRLGGPWKEDTAVDTINYLGAYCTLREEFDRFVNAAANGIGRAIPNGQANILQTAPLANTERSEFSRARQSEAVDSLR